MVGSISLAMILYHQQVKHIDSRSGDSYLRMLNEVKALTCICRSKATITLNEDYDHRRDHLVQYYGSYDSPYTNNTCLVLEYLSGSSLQNMITSGKAFSEEEVLAIAYSVLCAMSRITELKFIHRDIKVSFTDINPICCSAYILNVFSILCDSHPTFCSMLKGMSS